ncbi:hypothetical protein KM043_017250 [Ampulex compressa]|nr:hypothetical protein KM043_017250 [Ampulex compressa]
MEQKDLVTVDAKTSGFPDFPFAGAKVQHPSRGALRGSSRGRERGTRLDNASAITAARRLASTRLATNDAILYARRRSSSHYVARLGGGGEEGSRGNDGAGGEILGRKKGKAADG